MGSTPSSTKSASTSALSERFSIWSDGLSDMRDSFRGLALISEGLLSAIGLRRHDRSPSGTGLEGDVPPHREDNDPAFSNDRSSISHSNAERLGGQAQRMWWH